MLRIPTRFLRRHVRSIQRAFTSLRTRRLPAGGKLHVGCGQTHLPGWINIDKFASPAADFVIDVRYGLPFHSLTFIFAEHFIEHLGYDDAKRFLAACRQALGREGVLRLSTPSLDWVYVTQYHHGAWGSSEEAIRDCFRMNKSFHGWGHQFLYNRPTLLALLRSAGFGEVRECRYAESTHDMLRGLEQHERWESAQGLPDVLVLEASGYATEPDASLGEPEADYKSAMIAR